MIYYKSTKKFETLTTSNCSFYQLFFYIFNWSSVDGCILMQSYTYNNNDKKAKWFMTDASTNKLSMFFSFVWKLRFVWLKKEHHWSRMSNGWLHFVDLFPIKWLWYWKNGHLYRLGATLWWDTIYSRGSLLRDLERLHRGSTYFGNEVSTRRRFKEDYRSSYYRMSYASHIRE